jgi:hypothetical protein
VHRGAAAGDAGDRTAAAGTGAAQQHVVVRRGDAPRADLLGRLRPWPLQVAVEDVAAGQAERLLEIEWALGLDAGAPVLVERDDVEQRLGEVCLEAGDRALEVLGGDALRVGLEQGVRCVQAEQCQRLVALRLQLSVWQ